MKYNIPERVLKDISAFAKKYSINKVILFGSRAKGTARERSDIDIAVSGVKEFDLLAEEIEDLPTLYLLYYFVQSKQLNHR